jgi:hypothetical protein
MLLLLLLHGILSQQQAAVVPADPASPGLRPLEHCDAAADVVIWGGTVCGVTASVAAATGNASVLFIVNGSRLGGMTSGGLGGVDLSMKIGGLADKLLTPLGRGFEPHVAESAMEAMLRQAGHHVAIHRGTGWLTSVSTTGDAPRRIMSVTALNGRTYCGLAFVDCSYEGDLLRLSGTAFTVGRESKDQYNESMAGDDAGKLMPARQSPLLRNRLCLLRTLAHSSTTLTQHCCRQSLVCYLRASVEGRPIRR